MNYEELVTYVKKNVEKSKVSKTVGHLAFQFNVEGEAEGAFYLEIDNGKIDVQPYEYYDRDILIITTADTLIQMVEGNMHPRVAYTQDLLNVYGDVELLGVLPFGK